MSAPYTPTDEHIDWLVDLINKLRIGGIWLAPASGVSFEKVAENHIRVLHVKDPKNPDAIDVIEKTKKVGEMAGIRVDTEMPLQ